MTQVDCASSLSVGTVRKKAVWGYRVAAALIVVSAFTACEPGTGINARPHSHR
jgi:hypothetical protein